MAAQAHKFYCICFLVYPNEQKVVLDMTLHMPGISAVQSVWPVFLRYGVACLQQAYDAVQLLQFACLVSITFQVLSELFAAYYLFHSLQLFIKASKLLMSTAFRSFPASTSAMAFFVSALGS